MRWHFLFFFVELSAMENKVVVDFHPPRLRALVISADQRAQEPEGRPHRSQAAAWAYSNLISSDQRRLASSSGSRETLMHSNYQKKRVKPPARCRHDDVQPRMPRVVVPQPPVLVC